MSSLLVHAPDKAETSSYGCIAASLPTTCLIAVRSHARAIIRRQLRLAGPIAGLFIHTSNGHHHGADSRAGGTPRRPPVARHSLVGWRLRGGRLAVLGRLGTLSRRW